VARTALAEFWAGPLDSRLGSRDSGKTAPRCDTGRSFPLVAECAVGFYRARKPQETPLYRLVEAVYDQVKGVWEERFERRYGFWRVFVDDVVNAYLDCGRFESGFARIRCSDCGDEYLVATSCQKRGFCPSCGGEMRIVSVILEHRVITRILGHLARKGIEPGRGPPERSKSLLPKTA